MPLTALGVPNVPRSMPAVRALTDGTSPIFEVPYVHSGVAKDASGNPLAGATVKLFRTSDDAYLSSTVADAAGLYRLPANPSVACYVVAYLAGSPDVAGTTVNTLVAVAT